MVLQVKAAVDIVAAAKGFFAQVTEFCQIVQEEFLARFDTLPELPVSAGAAMAFTETLILCPTAEAARLCVRKDLIGAVSFVFVLQGLQQRIERGGAPFPSDPPEHQTRFYLLACMAQEYLDSLRAQAA
jgi:hypothetical protein